MPPLIACGNEKCEVALQKVRECASCMARSYCSRDCQKADWATHRKYCTPRDSRSADAQAIQAYNKKHQNMCLFLMLEMLGFKAGFSHLQGSDRRKFLPLAQTYFLRIYLSRVDNFAGGRHNSVALHSIRLDEIERLPDDLPTDIRCRLDERFPAICLGFTIFDPLSPPEEWVTTITHRFSWPPLGYQPLGIAKTVRFIWMAQWFLQTEAAARQAAREAAEREAAAREAAGKAAGEAAGKAAGEAAGKAAGEAAGKAAGKKQKPKAKKKKRGGKPLDRQPHSNPPYLLPHTPYAALMSKSRAARTGKPFSPYEFAAGEPIVVPPTFIAREYIKALASEEPESDSDLSDADADNDANDNDANDNDANGRGPPLLSDDCDNDFSIASGEDSDLTQYDYSEDDTPPEAGGGTPFDPTPTPSGAPSPGAHDFDFAPSPPNPPPSPPSPSGSASKNSPGKKMKNRKSTLRRRSLRTPARAAAQLQAKRDAKACILKRQHEACMAPIQAPMDCGVDFDGVLTGPRWTALRESRKAQDRTEYSLQELLDEHGMQVVDWNGRDARPIVDCEGKVFAVLAGTPRDRGWADVQATATEALEQARRQMQLAPKYTNHRRGRFPAIAAGISHGGGQTRPSVLRQTNQNRPIINSLFQNKALRRISGYTNCIFRTYARRLYDHYCSALSDLRANSPNLTNPIPRSAFAACTINLGPRTVSFPHRDYANLTWGWCSVTALGSFNPDRGGHLVMWDLKLIIRFPPGSTILLPSALVKHSNVPIADGEARYSFAQYSAGGLFRWRDNGFQSHKSWEAKATAEDIERRQEDIEVRWARGLGMLSNLEELQLPPSPADSNHSGAKPCTDGQTP